MQFFEMQKICVFIGVFIHHHPVIPVKTGIQKTGKISIQPLCIPGQTRNDKK